MKAEVDSIFSKRLFVALSSAVAGRPDGGSGGHVTTLPEEATSSSEMRMRAHRAPYRLLGVSDREGLSRSLRV